MKTDTKYFGEIDYEDAELIHFPSGLFGFEDETEFLLLSFPGDGPQSLFCLQSVRTPRLAFVAMDPFVLDSGYQPVLREEELQALGVGKSEDLFYYTLCAVKNPVSERTVNFKCPIAVREETRTACQVILDDPRYGMRQPLSSFAARGETSC